MAAVWKLPLVLVIENNRYAFSTPARLQYACRAARRPRPRLRHRRARPWTATTPTPWPTRYDARRRPRPRRRGADAARGDARPHARPRRGRRLAEGRAARRSSRATCAADPVPAYAPAARGGGRARRRDRASGSTRASHELVETRHRPRARRAAAGPGGRVRRRSSPPRAVADGAAAPRPRRGAAGDLGADRGLGAEPARRRRRRPDRDGGFHRRRRGAEGRGEVDLPRRHPPGARARRWSATRAVVLMGQDIGAFEGAFRVTRGLIARWPERVLDTPIAESGTIGIAVGAALLGYPPVVEMQFADFVSCGFNQIVNVAGQALLPLRAALPDRGPPALGRRRRRRRRSTRRTPRAGSRTPPASRWSARRPPRDAKGLLKAAIRDPNPVIFCEHKFLYRRIKEMLPAGERPEPSSAARGSRARARDLTLVGYGATTWTCARGGGASWRRRASRPRSSTCARSCPSTRRRCSPR